MSTAQQIKIIIQNLDQEKIRLNEMKRNAIQWLQMNPTIRKSNRNTANQKPRTPAYHGNRKKQQRQIGTKNNHGTIRSNKPRKITTETSLNIASRDDMTGPKAKNTCLWRQ